MKTLTIRSMIAVAALAVAAGSASAQTFKAEIPMSFRAGDKLMASGSYQVRVETGASGKGVVFVHNLETHDAVALLPGAQSDPAKSWLKQASPVMAFKCFDGACTLGRLWNGETSFAYNFPMRTRDSVEGRQATVVTLPMLRVH
jgi:hypothetical protein